MTGPRPKALLLLLLPECPVCGKPGVSPAHILGHGGKGVPKTIDDKERAARRARAAAARTHRWPKKSKKAQS